MFSCYVNDKKNNNSMKKDLNNTKASKQSNKEDSILNNPDNLKKLDENSLLKLKTKLNIEYQNLLYENELNTNKVIFYKKYIDQCKKNFNIEQRNEMIKNEFLEMRNKFTEINNEYLSLFDSLSSLTNRYSKIYQISEKIYLLENRIQEQENTLRYLNERIKLVSNHKNIEGNLISDIFYKLYENKIDENTWISLDEKNSDSSSSSSSSSSDNKRKSLNTISNNVDDIKKVKLLARNNINREDIDDYKRILAGIHKKNYEHVTKDYQKIMSDAQHELLNKNNNLKKLELIKNDIEMLKDPSKKGKLVEDEEKINMENKSKEKEKERKSEIKHYKQLFYEKMKEFDELKEILEKLNRELISEKEKYNQVQINLKNNNDNLNSKINEGNDIEIQFDEIKNERNKLIEKVFGNSNNNYIKSENSNENFE